MELIILMKNVFIIFLVILHSSIYSTSIGLDYSCLDFSCGSNNYKIHTVQYPFINVLDLNTSKEDCGLPGFDLRCPRFRDTTIDLPNSGEFVVDDIDYDEQRIQLVDPQNCLPGRILDLLSDPSNSAPFSPFSVGRYSKNYTFLSCCRNETKLISISPLPIIDCLSNPTVMVVASSSTDFIAHMAPVCNLIGTVAVPESQNGFVDNIAAADFTLSLFWNDPVCLDCVAKGGSCQSNGTTTGRETICIEHYSPSSVSQVQKGWEKFVKIAGFCVLVLGLYL